MRVIEINHAVDHEGKKLPRGTPIFPPPAEIGDLLSVDPEMHEKHPIIGALLVLLLVVIAVAGLTAGIKIIFFPNRQDDPDLEIAIGLGLLITVPVAWAAVLAFNPPRQLSYVGRKGLALFTRDRSGESIAKATIVSFEKTRCLFAHRRVSQLAGICERRATLLKWEGETPFNVVSVSFGDPPNHHQAWFVLAAEAAWSEFVWRRLTAEFNRTGLMTFPVNTHDCVRVGVAVLYFELGSRRERLLRNEIAKAYIFDGIVYFRHENAKLFARTGKFDLQYAKIANAVAFFRALETLCKLTVREAVRPDDVQSVI